MILFDTFEFKIEKLCHGFSLVISPKQIYLIGKFAFQSQQQRNDFNAEKSPIYIIAEKQKFV